tara:strand:+ start:158 stop:550 length:393 start_codon:yes stop_codon:yes gene_type:complete
MKKTTWKSIKQLIKEELEGELSNQDPAPSPKTDNSKLPSIIVGSNKLKLRLGVNKNETKLGIKVKFISERPLDPKTKIKLEIAIMKKLQAGLASHDMIPSKDPDEPEENTIGVWIPITHIRELILDALNG